jgi:hypothetical protein
MSLPASSRRVTIYTSPSRHARLNGVEPDAETRVNVRARIEQRVESLTAGDLGGEVPRPMNAFDSSVCIFCDRTEHMLRYKGARSY